MPSQTLRFTKASRASAVGVLSRSAIDIVVLDLLRRWARERAGRSFDVLEHAMNHAVATIGYAPEDSAAHAQLDRQFAIVGIDADLCRD